MFVNTFTMSTKPETSKRQSKKIVELEEDSDFEIVIESSDDDEEETVKKDQVPIRVKELEVKCLDLHRQILLRPDTYIGSVKRIKNSDKIWVVKDKKFIQSTPTYSEGLLRKFVEAASNAIDNVWRSKEFGIVCKTIKINIDRKTGKTSIWNDGKAIPLDFNNEQNKYNIELLFSRLLTSTNYDDTENRKTSGRNGYGVKLCLKSDTIIPLWNGCYNKQLFKQLWTKAAR